MCHIRLTGLTPGVFRVSDAGCISVAVWGCGSDPERDNQAAPGALVLVLVFGVSCYVFSVLYFGFWVSGFGFRAQGGGSIPIGAQLVKRGCLANKVDLTG